MLSLPAAFGRADEFKGPGVLASAATGFIETLKRKGGDADAVFGRAGIPLISLKDPLAGIPLNSYCELFESAALTTGDDNFGLWFGNQFAPLNLGPLGYLAIKAPTMESAVRNLIRFFPLHQQGTAMRLIDEGDLLRLEYLITSDRVRCKEQDAELSLGMFCNIFKTCHGQGWAPQKILLEGQSRCGGREHESAFGTLVEFNQLVNAIIFRRADLEGRMPEGDGALVALLEAILSRFPSGCSRGGGDFLDRMRFMLRVGMEHGTPKQEDIAAEMGLGVGTLKRRLGEHNVTFRQLLEETRFALAVKYLTMARYPLMDVAMMLGYSEHSAFDRAFRRWTGMSPKQYTQLDDEKKPRSRVCDSLF